MSYAQLLLPLILLVLAIGTWRCWKLQKPGRPYLVLSGVVGLFLVSWPPAAWLLARPLEGRYTRRAAPIGDADAIVVLSSNVKPPLAERPIPLADRDTYERCQYAAWLYKNWRKLPVLACGGVGPKGSEAFSVTMQRLLEAEGVPESQAWIEDRSRSTYENAKYGAELLKSKGINRIVLVTDAYHMPRAQGCFRKQGLSVVPAPCGFIHFYQNWEELLPRWKAIDQNELTLHEFLGLAWYRVRGWI